MDASSDLPAGAGRGQGSANGRRAGRQPGASRGGARAQARHGGTPDLPEGLEGPLLPVEGLNYGVLDSLLGYALRRAQNALYLDFHRATAGADISPQRFAALELVGRNPGMRQGLLGQAMGLHRSGALRLTDWLTARGWVERRDDSTDARSWGLHLTPAGAAALAALEDRVQAHDQALMEALGAQGALLKQALERLAVAARVTALAAPPALPEEDRHG